MHLLDDAAKQSRLERAGQLRDSVAQAGVFILSPLSSARSWTFTELADEHLALSFDDQRLYLDFAAMLGASPATSDAPAASANVVVDVLAHTGVEGYGYLRVARDGRSVPVLDYFIGYGRVDCPYEEIGRINGWTAFSDAADKERPVFLVQNEHCFFRLTET